MKLRKFLGEYKDMAAVQAENPSSGREGDYLVVDGVIKGWDIENNIWADPIKKDVAPVRATEQVFGDLDVHHNIRVGGNLSAQLIRGRNAFLGLFDSEAQLPKNPCVGEWAMVFAYTSTPANTEEETPAESEQTQEPASNAETSSENTETRRTKNEICVGYIFTCESDGEWTNTGYKGGYQGNLFEAVEVERERAKTAEEILQGNIHAEAQAREQEDQDIRETVNEKEKKLYKAIASVIAGGVALKQSFGDSEEFGISQKVLTESRDNLQNQINAIVNDKAQVNLTVTPSHVFVGEESDISLVASTNTEATSIKIKKGDTELATGEGMSLNGSDTITPTETGITTYMAEFIIAGLQKQATKNVVAVYPIMYGTGQTYTDAEEVATPRSIPAGTYNITVTDDEDYVFFVVPRTMNITSAKMNGFDFPLQEAENVEIEGVEYKYYQSANTYDADTVLTIVIS